MRNLGECYSLAFRTKLCAAMRCAKARALVWEAMSLRHIYCAMAGVSDHNRLPWRFFGLMSSSDGR